MSYGPYFADVYARTRLLDMGIRFLTTREKPRRPARPGATQEIRVIDFDRAVHCDCGSFVLSMQFRHADEVIE